MPDNAPQFNAFDPEAEVDVSERNMPHWFQPGVAVFVTMRTNDSMRKGVLKLWDRQQRDWLLRQGYKLSPHEKMPHWNQLPQTLKAPFRKTRDRLFHWHLDCCHGACRLQDRDLGQIVLDSLWHYTATEINRRIGKKGYFWEAEPFDHLIRSSEQFFYLRNYIAQNGVAAKLPGTDWLFRKTYA